MLVPLVYPAYSRVWPGDVELVENLNEMGSTFWLLLLKESHYSNEVVYRMLDMFIEVQRPQVAIISTTVDVMEIAAMLGVTVLPQLRLYSAGVEVVRKRGTITYDVLQKFLMETLKIQSKEKSKIHYAEKKEEDD